MAEKLTQTETKPVEEESNIKSKTTTATGARQKAKTKPKQEDDSDVYYEELNLDAKVTIKNLAGWKVTFARIHDGVGDVLIAENGQQRLSRNEVQAQVNSGNKLFVGSIDGRGSHATLYIEDAPTRRLVGFEEYDRPQLVFTEETVKRLFEMSYADFEKNLPIYIVTRAEKYALIEAIKKLGLNDYKKIVLASEYTGYKI